MGMIYLSGNNQFELFEIPYLNLYCEMLKHDGIKNFSEKNADVVGYDVVI